MFLGLLFISIDLINPTTVKADTFEEMMEHPLTDQWNRTFLDEWETMHTDGKLAGVPVVS